MTQTREEARVFSEKSPATNQKHTLQQLTPAALIKPSDYQPLLLSSPVFVL